MADQVYILIPIHNRKRITLTCLETLDLNGDLDHHNVVVINDGSTDGTGEAIRDHYPAVTILEGDGHLWWTGAIRQGMEYAFDQGASHFIWLNDDTLPLTGSIQRLVNYCDTHPQTLVSAQCYETAALNRPTYGGYHRQGLRHFHGYAPSGTVVECDTLNGNLACLPRAIVDQIGWPPSQQAPHYFGDVLYTWRAKQAGFKLVLLGDANAISPMNPGETSWLLGTLSIYQRLKSLTRPKSWFYPPGQWQFCRTIWPVMGVIVFLKLYMRLAIILLLRLALPRVLLQQLKSHLGSNQT